MPNISKLNQLLKQQSLLVEEIAKETRDFDGDKLVSEIEQLKSENDILNKSYADEKAKNKQLEANNMDLSEALASQISSEKSRFLKNSEAKLNAYFDDGAENGINALAKCERDVKNRFETCRKAITYEFNEHKKDWLDKIDTLEKEIAEESRILREEYRAKAAESKIVVKAKLDPIENQKIDEEKINKVLKQSNVERFIGASLLGKIGAVLIIIAVIFLSYLAYDRFNNILKCLFLFSIATGVFIFALLLNRKKRTPFSITILSLSIGLFYAALAISYFSLKVFNGMGGIWIALAILMVINGIGYLLSSRFKSQSVAIFAQIGGYLPMITIMAASFGKGEFVYASMVFFLVLSVLGFLLSTKFKWQILNFIAFILNIVGLCYITISVAVLSQKGFSIMEASALIYVFLSFSIYVILPILTNIRIKARFNLQDFALILYNTLISMPLLFIMFYVYGIGDYAACLALVFAAVYFGLYFLIRKFFTLEFNVKTLFWLVGIAFIFMFPPMLAVESRPTWFTFGWLLQGAALLIYGMLKGRKMAFYTGLTIFIIALWNFIVIDLVFNFNMAGSSNIFVYKYAVITLLGIILVGLCVYKRFINIGILTNSNKIYRDKVYRDQNISLAHLFSGAVYLNTWGFVIYFIYKIFDWANANLAFKSTALYSMIGLMILAGFGFAVLLPILFKTRLFKHISIYLGSVNIFALFILNSFRLNALSPVDGKIKAEAFGVSFLIILLTAASLCALFDLYFKVTKRKDFSFLVTATFYVIIIFTHILLVQYRLKFYNITFSITYIFASMFLIGLGLYFRDPLTRRFGLAFAALSIVKLALLDTWQLGLPLRIVIYTVFGLALIGMSYLYQLFYKKFGKKIH